MSTTIEKLIEDCQNWLKLTIFSHVVIRNRLIEVLHNTDSDATYTGLPSTPADLYIALNQHCVKLSRLKPRVFSTCQWEILFPPGKTETNSEDFDVTITLPVLENCTSLPAPDNGWADRTLPPITDQSKAANSVRAKMFRNFLMHYPQLDQLDDQEFEDKWTDGTNILSGLGYTDWTYLKTLKGISLDPENHQVLAALSNYINVTLNDLRREIADLKTVQQSHNNDFTRLNQDVKDAVEGQIEVNERVAVQLTSIQSTIQGIDQTIKATDKNIFLQIKSVKGIIDTLDRKLNTMEKQAQENKDMIKQIIEKKPSKIFILVLYTSIYFLFVLEIVLIS